MKLSIKTHHCRINKHNTEDGEENEFKLEIKSVMWMRELRSSQRWSSDSTAGQ